ncbi:MAG TPA: galactokinase [Streptosporangiaceae bacterium]
MGDPRGAAAAGWFRDRYGTGPAGVWHAPGRVNLIGEHTDYNDGFVLPFALAQGVRAAASPRDDDMLELCSRQFPGDPVRVKIGSLAPGGTGGWAGYCARVAWALREAGHHIGGARLAVDSDLPKGAGLSSSAAIECATAAALTGLYSVDVALPELARLAQHAENDFVGTPCGIMDQSASLECIRGHALLLDCRSLEISQVPLDVAAAGLELLVLDTKVRHELSDGLYAARRRACEQAAQLLGVPALRDVTSLDTLNSLENETLRRRARHVVTDDQRVTEVVALLRTGAVADAGPLLTRSHRSLRDDFEVSWPQADVAVDTALAAGALGARMMGGGFGGSVIALVPAGGSAQVVAAAESGFRRRGWHPPEVVLASPEDGAYRMT